LLLWIYYSAQILFFGAELTQVYANNYGSRIIPDAAQAGAQPATKTGSGAAPAATASNREVPAMPAVVAVDAATRQHRLEKENRQTARALAGMILASFFTGLFTTIVALRKR
jgi:membrane protein